MKVKRGLLSALAASAVVFGAHAAAVHASGYAVFTHGASALGQGNAVTAHASDPSTIFYNPAMINKLDGTQVQVGTTAIFSNREFEPSAAGGTSASNDTVFFPSHFYATHKTSENLSFGLGVFNPFGLGTEWSDSWDGRYIATKSTMKTFNINPAISYRVTPTLSVAAGVDVVLLDATLEKKVVNSLALGIPGPAFDVGGKFKGDGTGIGYNLGAAYDINNDLSLGISYRSQVVIDVKGTSSTTPVIPALNLNDSGKATITLPPQVTAAVAYRVSEPLTVEAGVRWEGWSTFKELNINLDNGNTVTSNRDWDDAWGANLGGRYRMNDKVALLAGYVYGDTPVPDSTFDPSIPDAKTHVFCAGADLDLKPFSLAFAYGYQLLESRTKNNNIDTVPIFASATSAANGKYRTDAHLVALSVGYKF